LDKILSNSKATQRSNSPDLTPSDFWVFPTPKMSLKGTSFAAVEDTKLNATVELRKIPKEVFVDASNSGTIEGARVRSQGSYFEVDKVSVALCPSITVHYHYSGNFLTALRSLSEGTR
jgi:hypothetical protein